MEPKQRFALREKKKNREGWRDEGGRESEGEIYHWATVSRIDGEGWWGELAIKVKF